MRIFLGGTCADTTWREEFIEAVKPFGIEYFNPVVKDWTPECQAIEEDEKNNKCDCHLYVITKEMMGINVLVLWAAGQVGIFVFDYAYRYVQRMAKETFKFL